MTVLRQRADGSIQSQPVIISAGQLNKPNVTELVPQRREPIEAVSGATVRRHVFGAVRRHVFGAVRRHIFGTVRRHVLGTMRHVLGTVRRHVLDTICLFRHVLDVVLDHVYTMRQLLLKR